MNQRQFPPDGHQHKGRTKGSAEIFSKQIRAKPEATPFVADSWQEKGVNLLKIGHSLFIHAPTSAGKTYVAEQFISECIERDPGCKIFYTTPIKSLSNDKYREFKQKYGEARVGIATGDVKEHSSATIVIMTQEIAFQILSDKDETRNPDFVVIDEWQFIGDEQRGRNWEFVFILLCQHNIQFLSTTATVENQNEFQEWLQTQSARKISALYHGKRPVTIKDIVIKQDRAFEIFSAKDPIYTTATEVKLGSMVTAIHDLGLCPTIFYVGTRLRAFRCYSYIYEVAPLLSKTEQAEIKSKLEQLAFPLGLVRAEILESVLKSGVAYYHAGLSYYEKLFVEELAKVRLVKYLISTSAICVGVNFAMRSCVFLDSERGGKNGKERFSGIEIKQMLGRVGRRGYDMFGYNIVLPSTKYLHSAHYSTTIRPTAAFDLFSILQIYQLAQRDVTGVIHFVRSSFCAWKYGDKMAAVKDIQAEQRQTKRKKGKKKKGEGGNTLLNVIQTAVNRLVRLGFIGPQGEITPAGKLGLSFGNKMGLSIALFANSKSFKANILGGIGVNARQFNGKPFLNQWADFFFYIRKTLFVDYPDEFEKKFERFSVKRKNKRGQLERRELKKEMEAYRYYNLAAVQVVKAALKADTVEQLYTTFTDKWLDQGDIEKILLNYLQVTKNLLGFLERFPEEKKALAALEDDEIKEQIGWEISVIQALILRDAL